MEGHPTMIYPTGYSSDDGTKVDFNWLAERFGIGAEVEAIPANTVSR
ncbi:MAG: hypothetical protein CM1200mP34_1940 [Verrucomicrobiales bacterium]|nr:MAG: hypothetical protein CM1200mP34_1940 [Verrucomicrobiales bacterium]